MTPEKRSNIIGLVNVESWFTTEYNFYEIVMNISL